MPKGGKGKDKFKGGPGPAVGVVAPDTVGQPASLVVKVIVGLGAVGVAIGLVALVIL